jgi:hypothetical protein
MEFKKWFLKENNIAFSVWSNNGSIVAYINGQRYVYEVDPTQVGGLQKLARYKPFSALNKIKELIKLGVAQQIEPKGLN